MDAYAPQGAPNQLVLIELSYPIQAKLSKTKKEAEPNLRILQFL